MLFSTEKLRPRQNQGQGNWLLIGLVSHLVSSVIMHYVRSNGWQSYKRYFVQTNNQFKHLQNTTRTRALTANTLLWRVLLEAQISVILVTS